MNAALAQLRDKMDPMYIISNDPSGSHVDAHIKKMLAILLLAISCFSESRLQRRMIFCEGDHLMKY